MAQITTRHLQTRGQNGDKLFSNGRQTAPKIAPNSNENKRQTAPKMAPNSIENKRQTEPKIVSNITWFRHVRGTEAMTLGVYRKRPVRLDERGRNISYTTVEPTQQEG